MKSFITEYNNQHLNKNSNSWSGEAASADEQMEDEITTYRSSVGLQVHFITNSLKCSISL